VYYDPHFLPPAEAERAYKELWQNTPWQTTAKINRWVCLMMEQQEQEDEQQLQQEQSQQPQRPDDEADTSVPRKDTSYKYRDAPASNSNNGNSNTSLPFTDLVRDLGRRASVWYEQKTGHAVLFNVCLLNFYEDGQQRIGWHSDREEVGRDTPIAALSLGATRMFHLRSKTNGRQDRTTIPLSDGSLTILENTCQLDYLHAILREPSVTTGRINLTFRCKRFATAGEAAHARRDEWLPAIVAGVAPDDAHYRAPMYNDDRTGGGGGEGTNHSRHVVFGDTASTVMPFSTTDQPIQWMVTTNLGAESYCAAELMELLLQSSSTTTTDDDDDNDDPPSSSSGSSMRIQVVALPLGLHGCVAVCFAPPITPLPELDDNDNHNNNLEQVLSAQQQRLLQSRSAHHVMRYHTHFSLDDLTTTTTTDDDDDVSSLPKDVPAERLYRHVQQELQSGRLHMATVANSTSFRVSCERIGGPHAFASHQVELYVFFSSSFRLLFYCRSSTPPTTNSKSKSTIKIRTVKLAVPFPNIIPTLRRK
jgi:alkylated DNA repair dioxygenase AlkB